MRFAINISRASLKQVLDRIQESPFKHGAWGALAAVAVSYIAPGAGLTVGTAAVVYTVAGAIQAIIRPIFGDILSEPLSLGAVHYAAPQMGYSLAGRAVVTTYLGSLGLYGVILGLGGIGLVCLGLVDPKRLKELGSQSKSRLHVAGTPPIPQ